MTKFGFFSIVEKKDDKEDGMLTVRARVKSDLNALRKYIPRMGKITASANSDYKYRARVSKVKFAEALGKIVMDINYDNFKGKILESQGHNRANVYMQVWAKLRDLQHPTNMENF